MSTRYICSRSTETVSKRKEGWNKMEILYETNKLTLFYEYETVLLKDKLTGIILYEKECYGDPECGLIDIDNQWAVIACEYLTIQTLQQVNVIKNEHIKWVSDIRLKSTELIEVLIDPWSDSASIWEINLNTLEAEKVKDFFEYRDKEYTDNVIW